MRGIWSSWRAAYMLGRDDDYVGGMGGRFGRGRPRYVDSTLGDSSENLCYEVDAEQAFARQPLGIPESAAMGA